MSSAITVHLICVSDSYTVKRGVKAVSYTHLDVYKRQKRNLVDEEFERVQESEYNNYGFD